jgi:molecular chaperone HtpG
MTTAVETFQFKAETKQLLNIMIHSIYSSHDVFLRELISNGGDALAKVKLEAFRDKDLDADIGDLHIMIEIDEEKRTLTIADNGIGMTHDEVVHFVGTIARSGTAELLEAGTETSESLIGRFGVGFYSTSMVADSW